MSKNTAVLAHEIPYWEIVETPLAHVVLSDGSVSSGLELTPLDVECFNQERLNGLTHSLRTMLNSLQDKIHVQFFVRVHSDFRNVLEKHEESRIDPIHPVILDLDMARMSKSRQDVESGNLYKVSIYVMVREATRLKRKFSIKSVFSNHEKFESLSESQYQETLESLAQNIDAVKNTFESSGIRVRSLNAADITNLIYASLNPFRVQREPAPNPQLNTVSNNELLNEKTLPQSTREKFLFGDLVFAQEEFALNSVLHRVITLKNMPEMTMAGMLSPILRFPFHYELTLSFEVPDQSVELSRLQQRRRMAHSLSAGSGSRPADLENESKLNSSEELLREILNSGQKIFSFQMKICLKAENSKEGRRSLEQMTREVYSKIRSLSGAEGIHETVGAWKVFKSDLPFAPSSLIRAKKIKTNNLADFLPVYGPRCGDEDPVVILHNRLNGIVSYNPFDSKLPNYNCLVTGSSGAGKSFLSNYVMLQQMTRKTRLFIIDIGGSYKKLTEVLDGEYFEVNLSDNYAINPFGLHPGEKEPSSTKLKSLVAIVEQMVCEDEKSKLSKMDRVLLERAIVETYQAVRGIPKLSDLKNYCEKSDAPELKKIAVLLYPWTGDRPYGKLLDRDTGLQSNKLVTAFDLKGLFQYPDLQSVMILILTDFIMGEVENDKSSYKRVILDEAWELLKSQAAANFMEHCVRKLRKSGSGITFLTQGLEEIVSSPIGSAIINNTATKFILLQRGDTRILVDSLKLNNQEVDLIQSLKSKKGEFSEAFLIEGDERQVVRVYPQPIEYWLSTSDAKDNLFLSEMMAAKGGNLWEAIKDAADQYPWGVSQRKDAV